MFAALLLCRFREAVLKFTGDVSGRKSEPVMPTLSTQRSWIPPDYIPATALPLATATGQVLASMHAVLKKTAEQRAEILGEKSVGLTDALEDDDDNLSEDDQKKRHLRSTKASEVRVVRYVEELRNPPSLDGLTFKAQDVELDTDKEVVKETNQKKRRASDS